VAKSQFVREQLVTRHDLSNFNSGESEIDSWLRESALRASGRDYSRTYVWHIGDDRVVAFFTLSAYVITSDELPKKQARGEQWAIPALLLGKFALDMSIQGKGFSKILIADAVTEAEKASRIAAARYLVVDALTPKLVGLYEKFGFQRSLGSARGKTRLFARIKDLTGG
jgi:GNAT superfamily N-acetyltransferase